MEPLCRPEFLNGPGGDFLLDGVLFKVVLDGNFQGRETDKDGVVLLKPWPMIEKVLRELGPVNCRNMLEFGIFQGGSAALWPLITKLDRYVGVDLKKSAPTPPGNLLNHPNYEAVTLQWSTSQSDHKAITGIINRYFPGGLDLVVDDASHQYEPTKRSFEIAFPALKTGGAYVVEDWAWSHQPRYQEPGGPWWQNHGLTNLIFDLVQLHATRRDVIQRIVIVGGCVIFWRGQAELGDNFKINEFIKNRDRKLNKI